MNANTQIFSLNGVCEKLAGGNFHHFHSRIHVTNDLYSIIFNGTSDAK